MKTAIFVKDVLGHMIFSSEIDLCD